MNKLFKFNIIYIFMLVILQNPEEVQGADLEIDKNDEKIFTHIYDNQIWQKGSGTGSYKEYTEEYRKILQEYFYDPKFHTIVDYGCGDFQIIRLIDIPSDKVYIGLDVVKSVIENDKKLFSKDNVRFYKIDDFDKMEDLNLLSGDLLIVKDVFIHWPNAKIQKFLDTVLPNFKYSLITNDSLKEEFTRDIQLGNFRAIDITKEPFNFNKNIRLIKEYSYYSTEYNQDIPKTIYLYTNPSQIQN